MKIDRQKVLGKYGGRCAYCGCEITAKDMQIDHINPKYKGGNDAYDNLNPSCRACNFYKGTLSISAFKEKLKTLRDRLNKGFIYRLARKHGIVYEMEMKEFYFEKFERNRRTGAW